ncbi:carboxypeptidase-like regulatory domain-containing protein [Spirosoma aerolatum]|uniref:carboxypeptidase-like regulatory domain-containing protein n=1 Tax=Spirosoma aerolatum TaxID=1211326 RepID=UPI002936E181|nr:carboxypeptidase-like regulatory domain-containing protein [Spirosoma aerolatum]
MIGLPAYAHLGSLFGTVCDQSTNLPIRDATVQLTGLGKATLPNELGQYRFDGLVAAPYQVGLSHVGYKSQVIEFTVTDDQTTNVKTQLVAASVELSEVVVSSQRPNDQQIISSLDIELRPISNSPEICRMFPGLFIGQHAGATHELCHLLFKAHTPIHD